MKSFLLIILLSLVVFGNAQSHYKSDVYRIADTLEGRDYNFQGAFKSIVVLNDRAVIYIDRAALIGNHLNVSYDWKKMNVMQNTVNEHTIPVADIRYMKVTRGAFAKGAFAGLIPGLVIGGLYGWLSFQRDPYRTNEDNKSRKDGRIALYALIGGVPTGITGGLLSAVLLRKSFVINGDRKKVEKVFEKYY